MKHSIIIILLAALVFSSCKKDNSAVFNKSPDERLNDTLAAYQAQLSGAQYGWKGTVNTKSGGSYTFYFKFNNSNRVQMLSSFDSLSAVTLKESSYRLKALQQPSLIFDTYSYIHVLADPNPVVNGGVTGVGLQSDFEFFFDLTSADTIHLVGRFNGSTATLVRATQEDATAFTTGKLADGLILKKLLTYYKRLSIGGASADFNLDEANKTVKITDSKGNLLDTSRVTGYFLTLGGINFSKPILVGNQKISAINNLKFVTGTQTISCTIDNLPATVTEVVEPLVIDATAPSRWWNDAAASQSSYISIKGFHVNGVDDAFKISSLPGYNFLYYSPKFGTSGSGSYDLLAPITNDSLTYGAAFKTPTFTSGLAIFRYLGDLGTVPADQVSMYNALVAKMNDRSGYYLIQTGEGTYDMVSARDGKAWVSWINAQ